MQCHVHQPLSDSDDCSVDALLDVSAMSVTNGTDAAAIGRFCTVATLTLCARTESHSDVLFNQHSFHSFFRKDYKTLEGIFISAAQYMAARSLWRRSLSSCLC